MQDNHFFDIPVYRITELEYETQYKNYIAPELKKHEDFYKKNPTQKAQFLESKRKAFGGMWRYNEIIGYIRLHILGSQIRASYFENDVKRHYKTRKKQFICKIEKLAPEAELSHPSSNKDVFNTILSYLNDCKKEIPDRFIDMSNFELIGRHLDWISLLESLQNK